jgi:hypothetical protein
LQKTPAVPPGLFVHGASICVDFEYYKIEMAVEFMDYIRWLVLFNGPFGSRKRKARSEYEE